jgi:PAS domain S-box-containing protein
MASPVEDLGMDAKVSASREALLERVFSASAVGMALSRLEDGRILEVNDAFCYLFGRGADELVGATTQEVGVWAEIGEQRAMELLHGRGTIEGFDATLVVPSGEHRVVRLWAEVVDVGEDPIALVRASDVDGRTTAGSRYAELREAEVRYRALVEQISAITYTQVEDATSPTGFRDVYISPQCALILGFGSEEWIIDPELKSRIMHPDDIDQVVAQDRAASREGSKVLAEYRMTARDGRTVWFRDEAVKVEDPNTGLSFWQGVMMDITELKLAEEQLAESEAKYRALVEQLPSVVFLGEYGEDGDWLYISPSIERVLGYTPEEWIAHPHPMGSFCHPEDLPKLRAEENRAFRERDTFRVEHRMLSKDGRWVWLLNEAAAVLDDAGRPMFMQGVMYDMTERKRVEEELATALDKLRALDRLKNTLLHTLSHDLKEPLTAILGAASTLERLGHELSEQERRDLLETMVARTKSMNTLLTDLLDLDRLDQGIVEPRRFPIDVGTLASDLLARTPVLHGRHVELDATSRCANVDAAKVERMIENLLANAARHTPPEANIWLRVEETEGGLLLTVEDEGPGVPDEHKELIFEPFRRGRTTAEGSGIGLSLVARFAELHGGRAWVEDRLGGGASFHVFVPDAPR